MRIAALDIGGTSIKSGIWDGKAILEYRERDTCAAEGGAGLMERIKAILQSYGHFNAIGISTAGQVNPQSGHIVYANSNLPGYTGMPVKQILEEEFQVPTAVENDGNAAALGELHYGAAQGLSDFLCLTYGTGVGGAIVINGEIYHGTHFGAGNFGGIIVHPQALWGGTELKGYYEKSASVTALAACVAEADPSLCDGRKIFAARERPGIQKIIEEWIDEIAYGLLTLISVFDPSDVILGGGVLAQPYVIRAVRERLCPHLSPVQRDMRLRCAQLGNQAGMIGAAYLAETMVSGWSRSEAETSYSVHYNAPE